MTGAVSVNEDGNRNDDYAIYDYREEQFRKVAEYDGFQRKYIAQEKVNNRNSISF